MTDTSISVGFFTPYYGKNRGNATTAKRIEHGLKENGVQVEIFAYEEEKWTAVSEKRMESCEVFHILHFYRFTQWMEATGYLPERPYLVTSGGTDVNHRLFKDDGSGKMKTFVNNAQALTVFTEDAREKSIAALGMPPDKVYVVPQSVKVPDEDNPTLLKAAPEGNPAFLLPAGLRPVKDVLFLLDALEDLQRTYRELQFVLIGSVLDQKVYRRVLEAENQYDWFHFVGEVPFTDMNAWYDWADIVLNTSVSEGQSSALLEALALGKLVMARENPGNASAITDNVNGFLFEDGEGFL
ncbi:MAG TPA: glycosyltransferase [Bacillales bacterium]|nr:glycosyltransferase [Bacillales bacterium]